MTNGIMGALGLGQAAHDELHRQGQVLDAILQELRDLNEPGTDVDARTLRFNAVCLAGTDAIATIGPVPPGFNWDLGKITVSAPRTPGTALVYSNQVDPSFLIAELQGDANPQQTDNLAGAYIGEGQFVVVRVTGQQVGDTVPGLLFIKQSQRHAPRVIR